MHWDVHATCSIRTLKDEAYRDTIKQFGLDALKKLGYTELLTEAATAASLALCEEDVGYDVAHCKHLMWQRSISHCRRASYSLSHGIQLGSGLGSGILSSHCHGIVAHSGISCHSMASDDVAAHSALSMVRGHWKRHHSY